MYSSNNGEVSCTQYHNPLANISAAAPAVVHGADLRTSGVPLAVPTDLALTVDLERVSKGLASSGSAYGVKNGRITARVLSGS